MLRSAVGAINTLSKGKLRRTKLKRVDACVERYTYYLHYPVNFDLERMKEALKGPFITIPSGLSREELRDFLLNRKPGDTGDGE